ncbi:hypothetical protein Ddc_09024 [Ditylenchus destructor]|nr:hypothetical protein Ddc_09024 [Ditylenchus destructor]
MREKPRFPSPHLAGDDLVSQMFKEHEFLDSVGPAEEGTFSCDRLPLLSETTTFCPAIFTTQLSSRLRKGPLSGFMHKVVFDV